MASQCLGTRLHPSQAPAGSQALRPPSLHTAASCVTLARCLDLSGPQCPHLLHGNRSASQSYCKDETHKVGLQTLSQICLLLPPPLSLPGPVAGSPAWANSATTPPTAATRGHHKHPSQILPPLPTALQDCHLNGVKAQVLPEFPKALLSSLSPQNSLCSGPRAFARTGLCPLPRPFFLHVCTRFPPSPPSGLSQTVTSSMKLFLQSRLNDNPVPSTPQSPLSLLSPITI